MFTYLVNDGTISVYIVVFAIPTQDEEERLKKLQRVFKLTSEYGQEINLKKCNFLKSKKELLRYISENGTMNTSKTKILAVQKFLEPKNVKQIQSCLKLTGYFCKFVPNYAEIA